MASRLKTHLSAASHNIHHYARANTKLRRQTQMLRITQASRDNLELFNVHKLPLALELDNQLHRNKLSDVTHNRINLLGIL